MDAYHEFIEPTRVSHCVACNFISPDAKHLVIAKSTLLQIFEVVGRAKLKLVEQFKLHGLITDLKPLRTVESPSLDYLLVSTKFAKMSLIKWNHEFNSISTVSLHYYENSIREATFEKVTGTQLIVEPNNNSCTCMRFKNILTFLPFEVEDEDDDIDDDDMEVDGESRRVNGKRLQARLRDAPLFDTSFMIDAQSLDPLIGEIVDMQFLYNYREPTLAIVYLRNPTWAGLLPKVKDNINFMIVSLDLILRSTTTVLKVENLPFDIDRIIPLPQPFNGSLLVGCNEMTHVDSGGLTKRIATNQYAELAILQSSFKNYLNQLALNLKLENCAIGVIPNDNKLLLILEDGNFYLINFEIDGKSMKGLHIEPMAADKYAGLTVSYPGEIAVLDNGVMFLSSRNGDSYLASVSYDNDVADADDLQQLNHTTSVTPVDNEDEDLYGEDDDEAHKTTLNKGSLVLNKCDTLNNNGPVSNFTLGQYSTNKFKANLPNPNFGEISIVSNSGSHRTSTINIMTPSIQPTVRSSLSFSQINRMWTVGDQYLITSDDLNHKSEVFQINKSFARLDSKDFINNQSSIAIFELGAFSVQITSKTVNLYDSSFTKLASLDEELTSLLKYDEEGELDSIIFGTLNDEFVLITLSTGEAMIFAINTYSATFTKVAMPKILEDTIITTGYIANSSMLNAVSVDVSLAIEETNKKKHNASKFDPSKFNRDVINRSKSKVFVLVTGDNRLVVFSRFHNEKCFQLNDLDVFSNHLKIRFFENRDTIPDPFIKQIVLNKLGDWRNSDDDSEFLSILTLGGEVILYKLYFDGQNFQFIKQKDLRITGAPLNAYPAGTVIERRMIYIKDNNGFAGIFVTGNIAYWISKTHQSIPRIFKFSKIPAMSFASFSDEKLLKNGFIFLDNEKNARICELPLDFNYDNNWPVKKVDVPEGETVKALTYHESSNTYVLSTYKEIPYDCLDEELNPIVGVDPSKPLAVSYKGFVRLLSPYNWTVIDTIELADNEIGMTIKSMLLDVGVSLKRFKQKREFIVVGTGKYRMEDLAANGSFKLYEIIDIIPEPGKPETNHKFKEFSKEDTRGAVTSICEVSGRFLVTQGQKIIVRDLQDNGTVPVAFLDTSVYVTEAKSFGNLVILGDSLKSVWLAGFDAEPFRMIMLGKDLQKLDISCADFIVRDEDIFILIADLQNVLHVLQYDPEDPASSNGQRLLQRASFNINTTPTCMRSVPKNEEFNQLQSLLDNFQTIGSTIDGSFFVVFPVSESTYRRMYIIQQQIIDKEFHHCGLNPRLNRFGDLSATANDVNNKPMLDYEVIKLFAQLNEDRKKNLLIKVGANTYQEIWKDLIEFENVLKKF